MAMDLTPEEHDANPPATWTVHKNGRRWQLRHKDGGVIDTFDTKKQAEAAKVSGRWVDLYYREGRWFKGETPPGMKSYAQCKAERQPRQPTAAQEQVMHPTPAQKAQLADILAQLRAAHPATADQFTLSRCGGSVGLTSGDTVFILYTTAPISDGIINARFPSGKYLTHPKADW